MKKRKFRRTNNDGRRICNRCDRNLPLNSEYFVKDSSRKLGLTYDCRKCHSERHIGRDWRILRWQNMTEEQKSRARIAKAKYLKTNTGRAASLRKAYKNIDDCDLTTYELADIIKLPCHYCGTMDYNRGLDRIHNDMPHIKGNVLPCCAICNFARGDRLTSKEMEILGKSISQILRDRKPCSTPNDPDLPT